MFIVHMAKVAWNFTLQSTPRENTKLKCSEISTLRNRQIKMQLKYSVLEYVNPLGAWKLDLQGVDKVAV